MEGAVPRNCHKMEIAEAVTVVFPAETVKRSLKLNFSAKRLHNEIYHYSNFNSGSPWPCCQVPGKLVWYEVHDKARQL